MRSRESIRLVNLSDLINYCVIFTSSAMSQLFETFIFESVNSSNMFVDNQICFKPSASCKANMFRHVTDYNIESI